MFKNGLQSTTAAITYEEIEFYKLIHVLAARFRLIDCCCCDFLLTFFTPTDMQGIF